MIVLSLFARIVGPILFVPSDVIDSYLPMVAPLPSSLAQAKHRRRVDQTLSDWWSAGAGFEVQPSDEIAVDGTIFSQSMQRPSTYGEVTSLGARQLFDYMGMTQAATIVSSTLGASSNMQSNNLRSNGERDEMVFVDLGSGAGKLVAQSYMELPRISRGVGVELAPSRHEAAIHSWGTLQSTGLADELRSEAIDNNAKDLAVRNTSVDLIQGDLFDIDLSEATHIYVASLCFTDAMMMRLEEKLATEASPSKLSTVASLKKFPQRTPAFRSDPRIEHVEMSWTKPQGRGCVVYFYSPTF